MSLCRWTIRHLSRPTCFWPDSMSFMRFSNFVFPRITFRYFFVCIIKSAWHSSAVHRQLFASEVAAGRGNTIVIKMSDMYMEQEDQWDREVLLDPAWEKQQKKVSYDTSRRLLVYEAFLIYACLLVILVRCSRFTTDYVRPGDVSTGRLMIRKLYVPRTGHERHKYFG